MLNQWNRNRPLFVAYVLLLGLLTGCGAPTPPPEGVHPIDPPYELKDFALTNQHNAPVHLSDLKGKLAVMVFGYTHCPDECPTDLANFKIIKQTLGSAASQIAFVLVSVDGKRDTPDVLTKYLGQFDPDFIGLTGDEATVRPIAGAFGVEYYVPTPTGPTSTQEADYTVVHTASVFLVDQVGKLRRIYAYGTTPAVMAADIQQFLPAK